MSIDGPRETLPVTPATEVWRGQESFQDALYEWMQRTPWLAISGAAHLVLLLILQAFPWALFESPEEVEITSSIEMVTEPLPDPPPPELDQEIEPEIVDQVPVIQELPTDFIESDDFSETPSLEPVNDAGALADAPFPAMRVLAELGLGGPPGGAYPGRRAPAGARARLGRGPARAYPPRRWRGGRGSQRACGRRPGRQRRFRRWRQRQRLTGPVV